jgi:hypothetical protein
MSEWYDGVNSLVVVETSEKQSFAPREASIMIPTLCTTTIALLFAFCLLSFVAFYLCLCVWPSLSHSSHPNRDHILNAHMRWVFLRVHGGVVWIVGFFPSKIGTLFLSYNLKVGKLPACIWNTTTTVHASQQLVSLGWLVEPQKLFFKKKFWKNLELDSYHVQLLLSSSFPLQLLTHFSTRTLMMIPHHILTLFYL